MSLRYNDAGSGPHDPLSSVNDRGDRNCGCQHDGQRWVRLCDTARRAHDDDHAKAQLEYEGYEI